MCELGLTYTDYKHLITATNYVEEYERIYVIGCQGNHSSSAVKITYAYIKSVRRGKYNMTDIF